LNHKFIGNLLFVLLLVTMVIPVNAAGRLIYVDGANGDDAADGQILTPFKTIQKAVDLAQPGTTIYLRAGIYSESVLVYRSGTSGAPITLTSYQDEQVTIDSGTETAFRTSSGVSVSYWTISGLTIRSTNRYVIRVGWWDSLKVDHFVISNNVIFGAVHLQGSYSTISNNDVSGVGYSGRFGDAGLNDANGSHDNVFQANTVHDFTIRNGRGIWTEGNTHDDLIEGNTVFNITTGGLGQCIDLDGAGSIEWNHTVRNNKVSNCSYVGIQLENVFATTVENNVITGPGTAGIIIIAYGRPGVGCAAGGGYGGPDCRGLDSRIILKNNTITTPTGWDSNYGPVKNWYVGGVVILNETNTPTVEMTPTHR
jgi:parallel beta-helix repeat protein